MTDSLVTSCHSTVCDFRSWPVEGDERDEKSGSHSSYKYYINLGNKASAIEGDEENVCKKAAVCQTKADGGFYREIGQIEHKDYFIEGKVMGSNKSS